MAAVCSKANKLKWESSMKYLIEYFQDASSLECVIAGFSIIAICVLIFFIVRAKDRKAARGDYSRSGVEGVLLFFVLALLRIVQILGYVVAGTLMVAGLMLQGRR